MKEAYEYNYFKSSMQVGLRQKVTRDRNIPGLIRCLNAKPIQELSGAGEVQKLGLVPPADILEPLGNEIITWPFPQIFKGKEVTLLCYETSIYEMNAEWDFTLLTLYDKASAALTTTTPAGQTWHFVDHGSSWILLNQSCVVYKTKQNSIVGGVDYPTIYKDVRIETGCAIEGRTILGGFHPGAFWNDAWRTIWDNYASNFPGALSQTIEDLDNQFILWSTIGGDLLWLFDSGLGTEGIVPYTAGGTDTGYNDVADAEGYFRSLFLDQLRRNELGWMPLGKIGLVQELKPIEKGAVAYGTNGVYFLYPVEAAGIPTIGKRKLSDVGVFSRGAISGDAERHAYIDKNGELWQLNAGAKGPTKRGYKEFLGQLDPQSVLSSYDSEEGEFYFSDGNSCFVLTDAGLSQDGRCPTSLIQGSSGLAGVVVQTGNNSLELQFDTTDFNARAIKTLASVSIGCSDTSALFASTDWYNPNNKLWQSSKWVRVNDTGNATLIVSATDFRIKLLNRGSNKVDLDSFAANYKVVDNRGIRGPRRA